MPVAITLSLQRVVPKVAVRGEEEETASINPSHLILTSSVSLEILDKDLATVAVAVSILVDADNTVINSPEALLHTTTQVTAMGEMTVEMVDQVDLADQADLEAQADLMDLAGLVDLADLVDLMDQGARRTNVQQNVFLEWVRKKMPIPNSS